MRVLFKAVVLYESKTTLNYDSSNKKKQVRTCFPYGPFGLREREEEWNRVDLTQN